MIVYLSLGSNLGNREQTIDKAIQLLSEQVGPLIKRSSFFYSKPWGFDSPNDFCNICVSFETELSPLDLLHTTQSIERTLGRNQKSNVCRTFATDKSQITIPSDRALGLRNHKSVYKDRCIDIDILLFGDIQLSTPELTIPHENMTNRDFVMIPLQEIAPHLHFFTQK